MTRRIITADEVIPSASSQQAGGQPVKFGPDSSAAATEKKETPVDNYTSRIIKLIPAEIVAAFVAADAALRSVTDLSTTEVFITNCIVFASLWIFTPIYMYRVSSETKMDAKAKRNRNRQVILSSGAFLVWVFTLGGPFEALSWYRPVFGTVMLILYTLLVPIVFEAEK